MIHDINTFIREYEKAVKNKERLGMDNKPRGPLYYSFGSRLRAAWAVLTRKAHAVSVGEDWQPNLCFGIEWPDPK